MNILQTKTVINDVIENISNMFVIPIIGPLHVACTAHLVKSISSFAQVQRE